MEKAILKTLIYADIFDYPMTLVEIANWMIERRIRENELRKLLAKGNLPDIKELSGFYYLKGKRKKINEKKQKETWSKKKLKIAKSVVSFLKYIPSIKLIGVSGALAMANVKKEDDIDFFIITSRNTLWITRLITTIILEVLGVRRHGSEKEIQNKICLNMLVDENNLAISVKERDIFTAHEVLQMIPLFERDNTYFHFIKKNHWTIKFLPNAYYLKMQYFKNIHFIKINPHININNIITIFIKPLEKFFYLVQLFYMRKKRTKEIVKEGIIRFHPNDVREKVKKCYEKRINKFKYPAFVP